MIVHRISIDGGAEVLVDRAWDLAKHTGKFEVRLALPELPGESKVLSRTDSEDEAKIVANVVGVAFETGFRLARGRAVRAVERLINGGEA